VTSYPNKRLLITLVTLALTLVFSAPGIAAAQFETRSSFPVQLDPNSIAVGDFNRDGRADLAVASSFNTSQISVMLGNGNGTFQRPALYSAGSEPDAIAVADMNHDGNLDLVVGNFLSSDISVLLGKGDGTFGSPKSYSLPVLGSATAIAVGDFNNDKNLDVAVIESSSSCLCFMVFLGNKDGTLQIPPLVTDIGGFPAHFAIGDFNSDGKLDVAISSSIFASDQLQIFTGNGDGTFTPGNVYLSGRGSFDVKAGDLTGNHNLDLVVGVGGGVAVAWGRSRLFYRTNNLPALHDMDRSRRFQCGRQA
jgi:hypothetical protein